MLGHGMRIGGRRGRVALRALRRVAGMRLLAALVFAVVGCAPRGAQTGGMEPPTMVRVDNRAFLDANVYVLRSGQRIRLGTATGSTTTTFMIPRSLLTSATRLSFLMDFVGSPRNPISEEITVLPGDTVMLIVPPQ